MSNYRIALVLAGFLIGTILVVADEPRARADRATEAAVTIDGSQLLFTPRGVGQITINDLKYNVEYQLGIPESNEFVTEVRACRWMKRGFAVVAETAPQGAVDSSKRSYHWITGWVESGRNVADATVRSTGERFLVADDNFDLGMIANPGGDSIYILLTKFRRTADGDEVTGYAYSHNCPIGPGGGLLQRIATDPKTMQWINVDPDDLPPNP